MGLKLSRTWAHVQIQVREAHPVAFVAIKNGFCDSGQQWTSTEAAVDLGHPGIAKEQAFGLKS